MTLWKQNKSNSIIVPSFYLICSHTISSFTAMLWQVTVFDLCRLGGWLVLKLMKTLNGLAFVRLWAVGLKRKWCLRQSPEKILQLNLKSISKEILRRLRVSNDLTSKSSLWVVKIKKKKNLPGYLLLSMCLDSRPLGWEVRAEPLAWRDRGYRALVPSLLAPWLTHSCACLGQKNEKKKWSKSRRKWRVMLGKIKPDLWDK